MNNGRASLHSNSDGPFCRRREDVAAPSRKTGFPCWYDVLGTSLPPVGTHIGLASYSSSIRRGSARRPLLSPAENKGFAAAANPPPNVVEARKALETRAEFERALKAQMAATEAAAARHAYKTL